MEAELEQPPAVLWAETHRQRQIDECQGDGQIRDVLKIGVRGEERAAHGESRHRDGGDPQQERQPSRPESRARQDRRQRAEAPEHIAEFEEAGRGRERDEERGAQKESAPAGLCRIIPRPWQQQKREGDIIPELAGERPQGPVAAVKRRIDLLQIQYFGKNEEGRKMPLQKRNFIDAGSGENTAPDPVERDRQGERRQKYNINAGDAVDEIFAQKIAPLANLGENAAADEIARDHEDADDAEMRHLGAGEKPPRIKERPMRRGHDVAEMRKHRGGVPGHYGECEDPAAGVDELRYRGWDEHPGGDSLGRWIAAEYTSAG